MIQEEEPQSEPSAITDHATGTAPGHPSRGSSHRITNVPKDLHSPGVWGHAKGSCQTAGCRGCAPPYLLSMRKLRPRRGCWRSVGDQLASKGITLRQPGSRQFPRLVVKRCRDQYIGKRLSAVVQAVQAAVSSGVVSETRCYPFCTSTHNDVTPPSNGDDGCVPRRQHFRLVTYRGDD